MLLTFIDKSIFVVCSKYYPLALLQINYKAKYEKIKMKNSLPADYPFFIQSRVNAYNLSEVSELVLCVPY